MTINTASKILSLYSGRKDIDYRISEDSINQTLQLLKSGGISSAQVYTGTNPYSFNIKGILVLRPNIDSRIYATIYVSGSDLYCIDYVHIKRSHAEIVKSSHDIFIDQLASAYEQMYDDYIREHQRGFISL